MLFDRHFTFDEASALIPAVQRAFARIHALLLEEFGRSDAAPAPAAPCTIRRNGQGFHHPRVVLPESPAREDRTREARALLQGLVDRGIVIQDVRRGLIDFPCLDAASQEELLLCYELADGDAIVAFHAVEAGFAGRRPIEELAGMP